jgi:5-methylcytosine-specific restriction endonuclease McrA
MFPDLAQTRFHQISDFYTLVVLISKFDVQNLILTDRRRNRLAWDLLVSLSNGVDDLKARQKKLMTQKGEVEIYRDYLLTVLEGTDEISKRQRREDILRGLLESLFRRRDSDRLFSTEQRRVLWNSSDDRRCSICRKAVTWADLTIDHVNPFSKGGRTILNNAALTHRRCNSKKGAR